MNIKFCLGDLTVEKGAVKNFEREGLFRNYRNYAIITQIGHQYGATVSDFYYEQKDPKYGNQNPFESHLTQQIQ